jgi:LysM repeat protein
LVLLARWSAAARTVFAGRRTRAVAVGVALGLVISTSAAYEVRPGDTLGAIAKRNGLTVAALAQANGIANPDLILIGQTLTIPGSSRVHTVRNGETLAGIAKKYGVTIRQLARANDIPNVDLILIGQKLDVPGGGSSGGGGGSGAGSTGGGAVSTVVTHVVKPGETLSEIAAKYGVTVRSLVERNDIDDPSLIRPGTKLTISGSKPPAEKPSVVHTVKAGETLSTIAAKYGVKASAIATANNIRDPNRIRVGQKLTIPGASGGGGGSGGGFRCPVPASSFVNDYGVIKPDGRFHQGIDMFAPRGTPVLAPVSGRVEAVNGTLGGLQFWLYGDNDNLYIGTHLDGFGQVGRVDAGAVIGIVGDTGNAIGAPPHLHFEILVDGKSTNPYQTVVSACR